MCLLIAAFRQSAGTWVVRRSAPASALAFTGRQVTVEGPFMGTLDRNPIRGHSTCMRAVNIKEAKAHLNELVEAASRGEEVVLMRGSKHVAVLVPITEEDVELAPRLADEQAARLWRRLAEERAAGKVTTFDSAEAVVEHLSRPSKARVRGRRREGAPR